MKGTQPQSSTLPKKPEDRGNWEGSQEDRRTSRITVAFDARVLQPETRHWGPGVFVDNIVERLSGQFQFCGLAHRFNPRGPVEIRSWPRIPKTGKAFFELSFLLAGSCDVYWGTNDFLPWALRKPSVLTVYDLLLLNGLDGPEPRQRLLAWSFSSSIRRAWRIIAVSKATADELIKEFPHAAAKVEVIHSGFDAPEMCSHRLVTVQTQSIRPYLLMLGAHRPRKNLGLAVAAVQAVRQRGLKMRLIVTGNIHPSFQEIRNRKHDFIEWAGVLPKGDVFCLLREATALLFPSIYEGFGLPLLEAMAAQCPVLALDTRINREIAGDAAWLLPDDADCWANAIAEVARNGSLRQELIEKGTANIRRFSWDKTAAAYARAFSEVCR
jgi:glycosyltransferase involved in cell wall biosynthesis